MEFPVPIVGPTEAGRLRGGGGNDEGDFEALVCSCDGEVKKRCGVFLRGGGSISECVDLFCVVRRGAGTGGGCLVLVSDSAS